MKILTLLSIVLFFGLMLYAATDLPTPGDPEAPANVHVSPFYLERAVDDANTPNVVVAVLADYRSLDTFGEVIVIFAAGLACLLVAKLRPEEH